METWRNQLRTNQGRLLNSAILALVDHYLTSERTEENFTRLTMALKTLFGIEFKNLDIVPVEKLQEEIVQGIKENLSSEDIMEDLRQIADVSLAKFLDSMQDLIASNISGLVFFGEILFNIKASKILKSSISKFQEKIIARIY